MLPADKGIRGVDLVNVPRKTWEEYILQQQQRPHKNYVDDVMRRVYHSRDPNVHFQLPSVPLFDDDGRHVNVALALRIQELKSEMQHALSTTASSTAYSEREVEARCSTVAQPKRMGSTVSIAAPPSSVARSSFSVSLNTTAATNRLTSNGHRDDEGEDESRICCTAPSTPTEAEDDEGEAAIFQTRAGGSKARSSEESSSSWMHQVSASTVSATTAHSGLGRESFDVYRETAPPIATTTTTGISTTTAAGYGVHNNSNETATEVEAHPIARPSVPWLNPPDVTDQRHGGGTTTIVRSGGGTATNASRGSSLQGRATTYLLPPPLAPQYPVMVLTTSNDESSAANVMTLPSSSLEQIHHNVVAAFGSVTPSYRMTSAVYPLLPHETFECTILSKGTAATEPPTPTPTPPRLKITPLRFFSKPEVSFGQFHIFLSNSLVSSDNSNSELDVPPAPPQPLVEDLSDRWCVLCRGGRRGDASYASLGTGIILTGEVQVAELLLPNAEHADHVVYSTPSPVIPLEMFWREAEENCSNENPTAAAAAQLLLKCALRALLRLAGRRVIHGGLSDLNQWMFGVHASSSPPGGGAMNVVPYMLFLHWERCIDFTMFLDSRVGMSCPVAQPVVGGADGEVRLVHCGTDIFDALTLFENSFRWYSTALSAQQQSKWQVLYRAAQEGGKRPQELALLINDLLTSISSAALSAPLWGVWQELTGSGE